MCNVHKRAHVSQGSDGIGQTVRTRTRGCRTSGRRRVHDRLALVVEPHRADVYAECEGGITVLLEKPKVGGNSHTRLKAPIIFLFPVFFNEITLALAAALAEYFHLVSSIIILAALPNLCMIVNVDE